MKSKILKLCPVVVLLLFLGASCQNDDIEYADESIVVSNHPGIFVFKTKDNYSDKIWVQITPEGALNAIPVLTEETQNMYIDKNGNVNRTRWFLLKSGYIIGPAHERAAFTNITLTEYLQYNKKNNIDHWPDELIWPRIIDKDPYSELYWMGCLDCAIKEFTIGEINKMLENGTLETVFTKLK